MEKIRKLEKEQNNLKQRIKLMKQKKPEAKGSSNSTIAGIPPTTGTNTGGHPQPASNKVDAKEPIMGGLADGHCRKEAWTGGKPSHNWTNLEDQDTIDFPQPTTMQSSSTKATTGHLKCTKGIFLKEAHRFKTGDDLDNLRARLETHFKKHRMNTMACRHNPNDKEEMTSVFTSHPLFTVKNMKTLDQALVSACNTCNKQNDNNASECFMNSLGEDL